jgi:hypothetical protein
MKKHPEALKDYWANIITDCVNSIGDSLRKPSVSNKNYLKYTESLFRLLTTVLESFKGKNTFMNDIAVKGFVYIIKFLFLGTNFQDRILKTLMVQHSDVNVVVDGVLSKEVKEETKTELNSDTDSNVGSTYTDTLSQDVLMKAKASACN